MTEEFFPETFWISSNEICFCFFISWENYNTFVQRWYLLAEAKQNEQKNLTEAALCDRQTNKHRAASPW